MASGRLKAEQVVEAISTNQLSSIVDIVNALFPTEDSLIDLPDCIAGLDEVITALDTEIRDDLHAAASGYDSTDDLKWKELQNAVAGLVEEVNVTAAKVLETRRVTDEIAGGIKLLDRGQENLTSTIAGLQRLLMFETTLENLTRAAAQREYAKCPDYIKALMSLGSFLEPQIDRVEGLKRALQARDTLLSDLKKQILDDLSVLQDGDTLIEAHQVDPRACCAVADVLSVNMRNEILMNVCVKVLEPYKRNFQYVPRAMNADARRSSSLHALETLDRRFVWLKKALKENGPRFARMFPPSWRPDVLLASQFAAVTRQHLVSILEVYAHNGDPGVLVKSLQKVKAFERQIDQDFASGTAPSEDRAVFEGSISRVFDSFMGGWYRHEDAALDQIVAKIASTQEDPIPPGGMGNSNGGEDEDWPRRVFPSTLELFRSLRDLSSQAESIGSEQMATDVMRISRKHIKSYLSVLHTCRVPSGFAQLETPPVLKDVMLRILKLPHPDDEVMKSTARELRFKQNIGHDLSTFLTTCATSYFIEASLPAMEAHLGQKLNGRKDDASLTLRKETHLAWVLKLRCNILLLTHFALSVLETRLLRLSDWTTITRVVGQSPWVRQFLDVWKDFNGMVAEVLAPRHAAFIFECSSLLLAAESIRIMACRMAPLSALVTEQLLLDMSGLVEGLGRVFDCMNESRLRLIKHQLQAIPTILKILRTSFAEGGSSDPDELNLSTASFRVMWNEFVGLQGPEPVVATVLRSLTVSDGQRLGAEGEDPSIIDMILHLKVSQMSYKPVSDR